MSYFKSFFVRFLKDHSGNNQKGCNFEKHLGSNNDLPLTEKKYINLFFHTSKPRNKFRIITVLGAILFSSINLNAQNMEKVKFQSMSPNLMVEDVDSTVAFYSKYLGFTVINSVPDSGKLDWAMVKAGNTTLMFQKKASLIADLPSLEEKEIGGSFNLFFDITGVEDLYQKLQKLNIVVAELHKTFYNAQEFTVKDPNGYLLTFAEFPKEKEEPAVTGVGGIFFKAEDPDKLKKWYDKHLGFKTDQYGQLFTWREKDDPSHIATTQWSIFTNKTEYFNPSDKDYMLNYRVNDLVALEKELREAGVTIVDTIEVFEYGKFLHIMDPEGNKIELWEPIDEVFTNE